jgi:anti-sigma-K factor RskA
VSTSAYNGSERKCGHDAGAYVLGALEPHEVEQFRRHMHGCAACRDEITSLGAVVEALPMAAPQLAVNRTLRRRVMADVRAARRASAREQKPASALASRSSVRFAIAAATAAAIAAAVAVATLPGSSRPTTRVLRAAVAPPASAFVELRGGRAELVVRGMAAPPHGDIYEVWLKRAGGPPIPTSALFSVTASGAANVDVPGDIAGVSAVLVTPERMGGSVRPTHKPVIVAKLA